MPRTRAAELEVDDALLRFVNQDVIPASGLHADAFWGGFAAIVRDLDLLRPIYSQTAAYGHFGRTELDFTWEAIDRADGDTAERSAATQPANPSSLVERWPPGTVRKSGILTGVDARRNKNRA